MKAACLACQAHIRTIQGMQLTIERLMKEKASIRNEALEDAAMKADSFYLRIRQYTTDVPEIGEAIRNLKGQQ